MPDILDDIIAERKAKASKPAPTNGGGEKPPSLSGTLPDARYAGEVAPLDPGGDVLDQIIAERQGNTSIPGPATGEKPGVYFGSQDMAPPVISGIPLERSYAQGGDRTQYGNKPAVKSAAKQPSIHEPNILDSVAPGIAKTIREIDKSGGDPRTMLANREAAEEKRREGLRAEKKKVIDNINRAGMQGKGESSPYVQSMRRRLYDIDQALGGGPAPSVISSGKAATQSLTRPNVRIIDETGGKETSDQRRERLTSEFNYLGTTINELGSDISKAKVVLDSGNERIKRLDSLIDPIKKQSDAQIAALKQRLDTLGQTLDRTNKQSVDQYNAVVNELNSANQSAMAQLKPFLDERNAIVKRLQGISASSQKKISDYTSMIERAKPVGKALDEYSAKERSNLRIGEKLNLAEKFVQSAKEVFGVIARGEISGYDAQTGKVNSRFSDAEGQAQAMAAVGGLSGAVAGAPSEITKGASNAISQLAGLGPIDESIYRDNRAVQITQTIGESAPYLLPGIGQVLMATQGAMISSSAATDPERTARSFIDSVNPFAAGIRPEERGVRALSLLMLAGAGKVWLSEALLKRNLMKSYGMTKVGANQILDWARGTVKQGAGGGVKGDVLYYLETLRGTKIGKVANQIAEFWHTKYQQYLAEGAQFAKDAKKAGATTTTGTDVVEGTPLTENVRPQTNAPELPTRSPIPTSATRPVEFPKSTGEPSGWKIAGASDRVQLINTDGGIVEFKFTPGDLPSYQAALAQARAHVDANPAAVVQPEPTMPQATKPDEIPWTDEVFHDHVSKLLTNPDGKLFFGGESFAGKNVADVPLQYAKTLLEGWKQQYDSLPNGDLKAKMAHDMSLLAVHVRQQTEALEKFKELEAKQAEEQAKLQPQDQTPGTTKVKDAASETGKVDPTGAWNNVQKYDLAKAKETDLVTNGGYKEVGNSDWFVGKANGGVGMFRPGEGKSYFFPFNDDEEGARKAATDWANNNPRKQTLKVGDVFRHYNGLDDFRDFEVTEISKETITYKNPGSDGRYTNIFPRDYMESKGYTFDDKSTEDTSKDQPPATIGSEPIKPTVDTKVPKGTQVATGKLFSGGGYSIWNEGTSDEPRYVIKTPDSVLTKFYTDWNSAVKKFKSLTGAGVTDEEEIAGFQDAIDKLPAVPKNLSAKKFSKESEDRVGNKAIHELLLRRALEKAIKDKDAFNGRSFAQEVDYLAGTKGQKGLPPASVDSLIEYLGLPEDFDPTSLLTASEKQSNKPETKTLYRPGDTFEHQGAKYKIIEIADDRALVDDLTGGKTIATAIYKKFRPDFPIDWKAQGRASDFKSDQSNKTESETKPTQVKDEPKTNAPSNDRQVKTGDTLFDTLREYDNKATDDELNELAADVDRVAKKTIKLWDDDWAQKENYRASFIDKIKDTIYNNAPMESNLVEMSDDVAQKIAETYIQSQVQFSRSDVQDEITKALYKMDVIRNVWKSGDKQNFELELTKQYDLFVGRRLGELAKARNVRGAQLYNEQGPSGGDDYNAIRQEVIRLLGHLLGALPSNQSQTPPVRTSLTDGFDIRGNRRVVDSILAFPQMDPNTPVLNGKNWKEHTEKFEALVEQEVLQGKVVVVNMAPFKKYLGLTEEQEEELDPFSVPEIEAKTAGVIPLRWGAPRVLLVTPEQAKILDGGDEPLRVWRLWRYKFDPKTDAYIVGDPNAIWNELMRRSGVEPKTELKNEVKEALDEVVKSGTDAINNLTDDEIEEAKLTAEYNAIFDEENERETRESIKEAEGKSTQPTQPKQPKSPRSTPRSPRAPRQSPTRKDKASEIASSGAFGEDVDVSAVANILDILGNDGIVREDTPNYGHKDGPLRAVGTNDPNPERIKLASKGFQWIVDRKGSVRASSIASEWVRGSAADLIGKQVSSQKDLAVIAQILRNPGYETFRWFAVKNGVVVAESAYSCRLPSVTTVFSEWIDSGENVREWLKEFLDENDADGFYLLHNHPSGDPSPSMEDAYTTEVIGHWDPRFKGHVVINSTAYSTIDRMGKTKTVRLAKKYQKQALNPNPGPLIGRPVLDPDSVAEVGFELKSPKGYVTMISANNAGLTNSIFELPVDQFAGKVDDQTKQLNLSKPAAYISRLRRKSGGVFMVAVMDKADAVGLDSQIENAIKKGFLDDVVLLDGNTSESVRQKLERNYVRISSELSAQVGRKNLRGRTANEVIFSEQVYAQLKPELQKLWNSSSASGIDVRQFFAALLKQFPATIKPYAVKFAVEVTKGVNNAKDQRERDQLDGDQSSEEGAGTKDQQPDVRPDGRGGKSVQGDGVSDDAPVGTDGRPREDDVAGTRGGRSGSGKRPAKNFVITDELGIGETTDGQKKRDLIAALELRQVLRNENRQPTKDEQIILARFPGTGWLQNRLNEKDSPDPELRDKIKALVSPSELARFRQSLVNSHYTSIPLIDIHWDIAKRLGYKGGPAVETSAGIGHFLGRAPKGAEITAIEFEDTAAEIMGWLYPESNVIHSPFEQIPANADKLLAISNIPFAISISDYDFQKKAKITGDYMRSHNYFFMKSLDHLVDGGLIIFTTSAGTLNARDAQAKQVREYLASKADFIGAIRLPNNAFSKNAGTDVTTDIVILRKRPEGSPIRSQRFTELADVITSDGDTATINQYFVDHPEMVLGTHSMRGKMYGRAENKDGKFTNYTVNPVEGNLEDQIKAAIERLPRNILGDVELKDSKTKMNIPKVTPPADLRTYRIFEHEGNFYVKTGTYTSEPVVKQGGSNKGRSLDDKEKAQIKAYIEVRDRVRALLEINATTEGEKSLKVAQANLKSAYDDYVKKYKQFSATKNISELAMDEDWPTVKALEIIDPETKKVTGLAPIFTQRVIKYNAKIDKVESATDALFASIHNYGKVDILEMSKMSGISEDKLIEELSGRIFEDPASGRWVTSDEYGSGNVKAKYNTAKELAEQDTKYQPHVEFLETRLPEDIAAEDIFVQIGAKWIPVEYYNQFVIDVFGYDPGIEQEEDGQFKVKNRAPGTDLHVYVTEVQDVGDGTTRVVQGDSHPFSDVLQIALSNKAAKIMKVEDRGEPPKFQPELTQAVNERIALLREEWNYYWKGDDKLSKEIAQLYNDTVNVYQFRSYDGSFLTLPGSTATMGGKPFNLRPWQKDQILRTIVNDFAYAAHGVGTGKTFEIIGGAMELRRIGKRNKILIATLKANKEAIAADFLKMYPDARILVSQEVSMTPAKRKEFLGRIQTGDYDAIIMHHDQFKKIPISVERAERIILEQIMDLQARLDAKGTKDKQIEKSIKALKDKLESERKRLAEWQDVGIFFEDLGIDHIMVDEAHYYRNIAIGSEEQGFSSKGSQLANDMMAKTDYLREIHGGATFFSGTPVVNSISEAYAIFRFMVPEFMAQTQTRSFDDWRTMYAELITKTERTITGAYKSKSSLFSFNNLTELKIQLRNFMDIKTTQDMSKVEVDGKLVMKLPKFRDLEGNVTGEPITVQSEPSPWQDSFFIYSKARAENIVYPLEKGGDNVLNIATDNRKVSNSIKMIDPTLPEEEDGKIMKAIKSIVDVYNLPESKENKATQLVFLDQGTPKPKVKPPENLYFTDLSESEAQDAATRIDRAGYEPLIEEVVDEEGVSSWNVSPDDSDRFNLYQFFKDELVARGIPEDEIAFIHDYVSDTARTGLFADMNAGRKRIMFASTKKGGVGVNVQERALAIHNIDCPWTPADREQRIGRVWRQGNMFDSVMLFDHMTVNSFDGFMYTKVAKKGGMIALLFSNDLKARSITDDVSDDAEMLEKQAAIASGRQDILEYENIKREYKVLQSQASAHEMAQRKMERRMSNMDSDLARAATDIDNAEIKLKKYHDLFGEKFNAKFNGEEFDSPKKFGEKLVETIKNAIEQRGAIVPGTEIRPLGYNSSVYVGEWNLSVKFEASPYKGFAAGFIPYITITINKHPYTEKFTLQAYDYKNTASEAITQILGELDPLGLVQRIRNMAKYPEFEIKNAKTRRQGLLDEKATIEKNIGKKFAKLAQFEELRAKFEAMDATVGAEIRSGNSGQFGSGEDVLPEGYWDEIYARKKAQKEAKDGPVEEVKEAAQAATTMNSNGIPPKAKPGGPIAGGTNLDDFFVDESKFESIRPLDAMLEFLAPGTRSAIARRTEILFRHLHGRQARVEAVVGHLLSGLRDYLDTRPVEEAHEFIDAIENGLPVPNGDTKTTKWYKKFEPKAFANVFGENHGIDTLQDAADLIRVTFDAMREEINNLDPSKLNEFYEYYFPHIWQIDKSNPTKVEEWIIDFLGIKARKPGAGKRPMEGSKGFLKKRTIPTVKEGLEKGLKLVSDNPVDIMLLKIREMNKFLIATRFKEKSIADGTAKFVALGATPPAGYKKVNSTFMDVYSPGEITVKFAYDKKMHDKLMEIGLAAGASVEWKNSVGRGKAGGTKYGEAGGGQVNMRYGANLEVLTHEIGHILDDKFGLKKALLRGARAKKDQAPTKTDIIVSEMKELAKLRYESMNEDDVSDSYARYTERQPELIANFIHLYVHSKGLVKKFAPNALAAFKDLQKSNKVLKMLDDVVGGAELSEMETTYSVFGRTYTGAYYFPETAAQVINNYLSPGLSGTDKRILRDLYGWIRVSNNALNSIQLGFDGFHGLVTALNAAITDTETAIGFLEAGDVGKAVKSALSGLSLVRPLTYGFIRGQQLRNAYLSSYTEDENMAKVVDWIVRAGGRATPDPVYMNDFRRKLRIAARDMKNQEKFALSLKLPLQVVQGAWYTINALNETTSHWLMESLVPALKLYAFENIASVEMLKLAKQKPNYTDEDMNATLQRAWDSVDNRFGQMVYDNLFFDKFVKDAATITFRAFGWSYGTIREAGGAAVDTVAMLGRGAGKIAGAVGGGGGKGGGPDIPDSAGMPDGSDEPFVPVGFTPRQRFMPALIGITALVSAIIQYLHTGKRPEELRDYMFPKNGEKNPDGSDQRLVVPTYTKDIEAWMTRPGATFEGKLAPWYTAFTAVISNQDFYGVKIANEKEGFLPVWKSRVEFIANEFVPVAFRKKNEFDNDGIALGPMTFSGQRWIGIMPAPMWTTRSEAIQKAYEFRAKRVAGIEKTREEQTSRDAVRFTQDLIFNNIEAQIKKDQKRSDAIVKRFEEIKAKYPKEVEQASKIVFDKVQNRPRTPIEIAMSNLSIEEIIEVRKVATRDEVIFIDQALSDKLSTLIHRGTLKNDDPMVLKATKAMEGKL